MSEASENVAIAEIPKGRGSAVFVTLSEFHGQHIDVRTYLAFTDDGELRPTKKGASLPITKLRDLRAALAEADRVAVGLGWLDPEGAA
jgi:hypothetical protein